MSHSLLLRASYFFPYVFFFFYCSGAHRDLHSFPTRRSSDLPPLRPALPPRARPQGAQAPPRVDQPEAPAEGPGRSEEHTSELQSLRHLVCRLLLEKKKKKKKKKKKQENTQIYYNDIYNDAAD